MLRFPNPGSTIANFVAVYTAAFRALNGRIVDLDDIVRAVVDANLATSSGYVGHEAVARSTRADRSRDPLYNQMKMYAELFRTLGWLHPTAASSLNFTFTVLGEQLVAAGAHHYWPLLRRCVLGISYPTHVLSISGDQQTRPFAFILKVMKNSGGYLSRDEMIVGPLSADDDRHSSDLARVLLKIKSARKSSAAIEKELRALTGSRGVQLNTLKNYTRWPIAVLRDSGWVTEGRAEYGDGRTYRVFTLTKSGWEAAAVAESAIDIRIGDVEKLGQNERDAVAVVSHFRMLEQAGYDVSSVQGRIDDSLKTATKVFPELKDLAKPILFSPFQSLSLEDIHSSFPESTPAASDSRLSGNAPTGVGGRDQRSHLFVAPRLVAATGRAEPSADAIRDELGILLARDLDLVKAANTFLRSHRSDAKEIFYPLVAHLFQILGFRSECTRAGVNYQRWDACVWIGNYALPVEIKSPTEEEFLATKAVRQALENKVVLLSRGSLPTRRELSSLVVGFRIPNERGEMSNLIDNVFSAFGISLGVIDLYGLVYLALKNMRDNVTIDAEQLAHLKGFLSV